MSFSRNVLGFALTLAFATPAHASDDAYRSAQFPEKQTVECVRGLFKRYASSSMNPIDVTGAYTCSWVRFKTPGDGTSGPAIVVHESVEQYDFSRNSYGVTFNSAELQPGPMYADLPYGMIRDQGILGMSRPIGTNNGGWLKDFLIKMPTGELVAEWSLDLEAANELPEYEYAPSSVWSRARLVISYGVCRFSSEGAGSGPAPTCF